MTTKKNDNNELENENQIEIEILKEEVEKLKKQLSKKSKETETKQINTLDENQEFMELAAKCFRYSNLMPHIKNMGYLSTTGENFPLFYLKRLKTKAFFRMMELAEEEGIISRHRGYGINSLDKGKSGANDGPAKKEIFEPKSSGGSD
jgi:hypothetical protein